MRALLRASAVVSCLAVTACGGGGGGTAPSPAPAPAPVPPVPTALDMTRVTLATQLPQSCGALNCLDNVTVLIDAAGEMTALWAQAAVAGPQRLMASSWGAGSAVAPTVSSLDDNFATAPRSTLTRSLGNRRFAIFDQARDTGTNNRARVMDVPVSGGPSSSAPVVLPAALQQQTLFRSIVLHQAQLYALVPGQTAPFPSIPISPGVSVTAVTIDPLPVVDIESTTISDFQDSFNARAYVAVRAKQTSASSRHIFLTDAILSNGFVPVPIQVSTQTFEVGFGPVACNAEPSIEVHVADPADAVVSWRQLNASRTGCDFNVLGTIVNGGTNPVARGIVTGRNIELVAVWQEFGSDNRPQIRWNSRPNFPQVWGTPQRIAPPTAANEDGQELVIGAYGAGGTLAIVWRAFLSTGPNTSISGSTFVSKYVNGAWTTVSSATIHHPTAIAINSAGQGVLLARNIATNCPATGICYDMVAYRF